MLTNTKHTPSYTPVVTLAEAKLQLRIETDFTEDDAAIEAYIEAAQQACVEYMGRPVAQASVFEYDELEAIMEIPAVPVAALTKVEYLAADGDGKTYVEIPGVDLTFVRDHENGGYKLAIDGELPETYESDAAVRVHVAVTCPAPVIQAIKVKLTDMYERREDRGEIGYNSASASLLRPYRVNW